MATTKYINRFLRGNSGCEFKLVLYLHPIVDAGIDRQQWMLLSGAVIVVIGQSLWNMGFRNSSIATTSLIGSIAPIVGILAAYLILGEVPTLNRPPAKVSGDRLF
jgi:drug/metabolite transporter (DMT)-like permease